MKPGRIRSGIPLGLALLLIASGGTAAPQVADTGISAAPTNIGATPAPGNRNFADADNDGIDDSEDNCTHVANPAQRDTDADNIGNFCDADIAVPNDCSVNFLDLTVIKLAFFSNPSSGNWQADADLNGDNEVNFSDLQPFRASFFGQPGPSGLINACTSLNEGDLCDPAASLCGAGLTCCYPCGVPDCEFICEVTCDPGDPACVDGCYLRP